MRVEPIRKQFDVKAAPERAFALFTTGIDRWWPREHHIGKAPLKELILEPKPGGRWYSIAVDGSECDIGKVLVWEPPTRVVLAWQVTAQWTFDPEFVTEIEVTFSSAGRGTHVEFEHRNLERYGESAAALREQLSQGWPGNLDRFSAAAALKAVVFYEPSADVMVKAPLHFAAHKVRLDQFQGRGELLAVGTFADPREGSMAVFSSRAAAEEFVREDPFVLEKVVAKVTIKDWNEVLL